MIQIMRHLPVNRLLFASRMAAMALGVMGAMGAMLSITRIFGMAAYSVSKRLKELGIRMSYRQRWDVHSNCWLLVQQQDCSSEFWQAGCWLSSSIRQLPATRS